jgi:hypothetical protein
MSGRPRQTVFCASSASAPVILATSAGIKIRLLTNNPRKIAGLWVSSRWSRACSLVHPVS